MGQEREKLGRGIRWLSEHTPDANVQQDHLRALRGAVAARPAVSPEGSALGRPAWQRRVALGTAWGMIAVPSTAFAAEGSAPGDLLYPIKRAVEPVRAVFDPDVRARHRVDEVARLIERQAQADRLREAIEAARASLGEDDAELRTQLDELERGLRPVVVLVDEDSADDEPTPATSASSDDEDSSPDDEPTTSPSRRPSPRATDDEDSPEDEPTARPTDDEDSPDDAPTAKPSASDTDEDDLDEDDLDEDTPEAEDTPDEPDDAPTSNSGSGSRDADD